MKQNKPSRSSYLLILVNAIFIIPFLLVCLVPFAIGSGMGWFLSILGMGFPYILFALILILLVWLIMIKKTVAKRMAVINVIVLLLGFQQIQAVFGFHFFQNSDPTERTDGIRVMSWNVTRWDVHNWDKTDQMTKQPLMFDLIEQINPDILLFQEFFNNTDPRIMVSYLDLLVRRGYPYYFYTPHSITISGKFHSGLGIFSRYPLTDTTFFFPESAGHAEGFQYADITVEGKKIRLFNAHLESPGLNDQELSAQSGLRGGRTILSKLKFTHGIRMNQAKELKEQMDKSPYPVLFGGDVDDIPNSTTYFFLRKGLNDVFLKKGAGIGRTFASVAPTLRIDYLFTSRELKPQTFFVIPGNYSAHYPIITDFVIP